MHDALVSLQHRLLIFSLEVLTPFIYNCRQKVRTSASSNPYDVRNLLLSILFNSISNLEILWADTRPLVVVVIAITELFNLVCTKNKSESMISIIISSYSNARGTY